MFRGYFLRYACFTGYVILFVSLREMAQALADLFGLTLPVSQKKLVEALSYSVYPCSVSPTEIPEGRVTPACQQMLKW